MKCVAQGARAPNGAVLRTPTRTCVGCKSAYLIVLQANSWGPNTVLFFQASTVGALQISPPN